MTRTSWMSLTVVAVALVLAGCEQKKEAPKAETTEKAEAAKPGPVAAKPLVVAINTWAGHAPGIVANGGLTTAKGSIYDGLGLQVEFKIIDDPVAKLAELKAGKVDVMWDTVDSWAREASVLASEKEPFAARALFLQDWSRGGDGLVAKGDIKTIEDLKGKKVAVLEFSPSHWFALYLLSQSGLTADEKATVSFQFFGEPSQVKEAFTSGKVDAMVSWQPFLDDAVKDSAKSKAHLLITTAAATNVIADTLVASPTALASKSKELEAFVRGWFKGMAEVQKDAKAHTEKVSVALKLPAGDVEGMLSGLKLTPFADNAQFYGLKGGKAHYETLFTEAFEAYRRLGKISTPVDAKTWMEPKYLNAIAGEYAGQEVQEVQLKALEKELSAKDKGIINRQLSINFVPGSAEMMSGSEVMLDVLGQTLISFGATYLQIEGNTDSTGPRKGNIELLQEAGGDREDLPRQDLRPAREPLQDGGPGPRQPGGAEQHRGGPAAQPAHRHQGRHRRRARVSVRSP
ncbi:MAG: transporter substrate-binding domain-containing protein [Myxococcales bacterium]